jgi:large subunit ribosomal protein L17
LVTYAKKDSLHGRRLILKNIKGKLNKKVANILIHDLAPNYKDRSGGYTRIIKLDNRKNDNADMCIIVLVDYNTVYNTGEPLKATKIRRRRKKKKTSQDVSLSSKKSLISSEKSTKKNDESKLK